MYRVNPPKSKDANYLFENMFSPTAPNTPYVPLLSWKKAQDSVPWNIILLLGGGFAMAKGCEVSMFCFKQCSLYHCQFLYS